MVIFVIFLIKKYARTLSFLTYLSCFETLPWTNIFFCLGLISVFAVHMQKSCILGYPEHLAEILVRVLSARTCPKVRFPTLQFKHILP